MSLFYNITGSTGVTVEIAPIGAKSIKSLTLTNVHATADATVTVFIENQPVTGSAEIYNIIHTIAIPADTSLLLDDKNMLKAPNGFATYITVGSSDTVDVIVSQ